MVKMPGFDELKKMGATLIDSAKSVNISEAVDKLKSRVDSMSGKKESVVPVGDDAASVMIAALTTSLNELIAVQALQASAIKKIQDQLADLAKVVEANKKPIPPTPPAG
jgi:hypothetical protein